LLGEFSGGVDAEPIRDPDPELAAGERTLETLEHDGIAKGFIDDIQGLLNGR